MAEADRVQQEALVTEYALRLIGERLDRAHPHFAPCRDALSDGLDYHCREFAEAKKTATAAHVLRCLRSGEFAFGKVKGCDWVEDVLLATLLRLRNEPAVAAFRTRFSRQLVAWQRLLASDDHEIVDEFLTYLITPREQSAPPIATYKAIGPLTTWLRRVFRTLAHRRRRSRESTRRQLPIELTDGHNLEDGSTACAWRTYAFGEGYDQRHCQELLAPLFLRVFDVLDERERTIVLQAIVDDVPQKQLARELNVNPGTITRIKQDALEKMEQHFRLLAYESAGMKPETVGACLELLLGGLGEPLLDLDEVRKAPKAAQPG